MRIVSQIFRREWLLAYRTRAEIFNPLIFFVLIISLFPLALGSETSLLQNIAPGIIWVSILLTTLLSLERLFREELDNGIIEQWLLSPTSFLVIIRVKLIAHWFITYFPLLLLAPVFAEILHLPKHAVDALVWSLLLGTPVLSFTGAIFTALTIQLRQSGLLMALLTLPFYIPVLIFASGAVTNAMSGLSTSAPLAFIGALLALSLTFAPLAVSWALKIGIS